MQHTWHQIKRKMVKILLYLNQFSMCFTWTWWRHQNGNIFRDTGPLCGEFTGHPAQRPVTQNFDVFFDLRLKKRLSKQSWGWWFQTQSRPFWRHGNGMASEVIVWWLPPKTTLSPPWTKISFANITHIMATDVSFKIICITCRSIVFN